MAKIEAESEAELHEKFLNGGPGIELDIIGPEAQAKFKNDQLKDLYPVESYFFDEIGGGF